LRFAKVAAERLQAVLELTSSTVTVPE